MPSEAYSQAGSQASELDQAVGWGTNNAVREAMRKFRRFLTEFRMDGDIEEESYYMRLLVEIRSTETYNINIDCQNLYNFLPTRRLYEQLVRYPQEIVPIMDLVVHQEYTNLFGQGKPLSLSLSLSFVVCRLCLACGSYWHWVHCHNHPVSKPCFIRHVSHLESTTSSKNFVVPCMHPPNTSH
jgi:DNA replication licensing factor MCM4